MDSSSRRPSTHDTRTSFQSTTFDRDVEIRVHDTVGSASVSPSGRDVVLASAEGLHIVDLDSPYSAPRDLPHQQQSPPADVQWSPFAARDYWIVSTSNQKALVWNLESYSASSQIQYTLHGHSRAITDINFSAHNPDLLATCAVDTFVHCWDLRQHTKPVLTFADWNAGATQVKWNRQDEHILASSHDKFLHIWDDRKGAYPLKTIEAHTTKIYGIDWNRTRSTGILTCSLDRSIKFWDYAKDDDKPERVIRTRFPVWRARHTPFGWGVLALPQRGDNDLHLYDRRLSKGVPRVGFVKPVHSFSAHTDNVKEFLWRSRGEIENGVDGRDFQLISWGMDNNLHLHRVDPKVLQAIGYEKGKEVRKNMPMTRKGATYKTFNALKPLPQVDDVQLPANQSKGLLGKLVSAAGMSKMPLPLAPLSRDQGSMTYTGKFRKRTADPIKWMSGVTMRNRSGTMSREGQGLENPESLKDEITTVSEKYAKVKFEVADVHGRAARATLNGPWGPDEKPAFLRVSFEFPGDYPSVSPAICTLEKTASGIADEIMDKLNEEMKRIVDYYQHRKLGCLEAVITYLLGERGLEESITLPPIDEPYDLLSPELNGDESSSDDDDDAVDGPGGQDMERSTEGVLGNGSAQSNVPLPKACGAYWAHDGRLICFFPPKPEPKPPFSLEALRTGNDKSNRNHRHFEGFGRLGEDSPNSKRRPVSEDEHGADDSGDSWTSSSPSSSEDSFEDITRLPSRFHPPAAWRAVTLRNEYPISHSGSGGSAKRNSSKQPKSYISIHDLSTMLPAKRELAREYEVFGHGPKICEHNAKVAAKYGYDDLATTWDICKHLLHDEVPLEIMEQKERKEPILIVAKRMMVRVRRKESGLDLAFDEPESVSNPALKGRVKWGMHPFGSVWLIPELFAHYEALADVQMLAMLSCIFTEPAAREGISSALTGLRQEELPIEMKAPAFSLDYFPSEEVAWSLYQESKALRVAKPASSPGEPRTPGSWDYFDQRIGTYGSQGSSNGPWGGDIPSGPLTPYSTGNTPPLINSSNSQRSNRTSIANSLSTSPEQSQRSSRRSTSNLSAAFSIAREITGLGSSPTSSDRFKNEVALSTSVPTSGVTWGSTTYYSGSSPLSPEKRRRDSSRRDSSRKDSSIRPTRRRSFPSFDGADSSGDDDEGGSDYSTDDSYFDYSPTKANRSSPAIKVTLKNQNQFDDEGHASIPLLPPEHAEKYSAYRTSYADQLCAWNLWIEAAEILMFNGFVNYWPSTGPLSRDTSSNSVFSTTSISDVFLNKPVVVRDKKGEKKDHFGGHRNCEICFERVGGLFVRCASGIHKAHLSCHAEYVGNDDGDGRGVSCGCVGEVITTDG